MLDMKHRVHRIIVSKIFKCKQLSVLKINIAVCNVNNNNNKTHYNYLYLKNIKISINYIALETEIWLIYYLNYKYLSN